MSAKPAETRDRKITRGDIEMSSAIIRTDSGPRATPVLG